MKRKREIAWPGAVENAIHVRCGWCGVHVALTRAMVQARIAQSETVGAGRGLLTVRACSMSCAEHAPAWTLGELTDLLSRLEAMDAITRYEMGER